MTMPAEIQTYFDKMESLMNEYQNTLKIWSSKKLKKRTKKSLIFLLK